jgi:hypothetical protein
VQVQVEEAGADAELAVEKQGLLLVPVLAEFLWSR